MSNYIVITTIHSPSKAILQFAAMEGYELVVVGDKKTPVHWQAKNAQFFSVDEQGAMNFELSEVLPFNHYSRKMLGYLYAIKKGASAIIDTDDDNIPKENWGYPEFNGSFQSLPEELGFINIYQLFTKQFIWPRGLPLKCLHENKIENTELVVQNCKVGIWQALADGDPDVDAVYRLTNNDACFFDEHDPIVLGKKTISPINSQNTIFYKQFFSLMYLPATVSFRFTDILRGLVAQPILWVYDHHIGFTGATVIQERNEHDNMKDFIDEIPVYINSEKIIELISPVISKKYSIERNLFLAYAELAKADIVQQFELEILNAWLHDIKEN